MLMTEAKGKIDYSITKSICRISLELGLVLNELIVDYKSIEDKLRHMKISLLEKERS